MPQVTWSAQAKSDLECLVPDPAVRAQIEYIAEEILPDAPPGHPADHGADGAIEWQRCITREQERQLPEAEFDEHQPDEEQLMDTTSGTWNFFLLFTRGGPAEAEVLGVRSTRQIASLELVSGPDDAAGPMLRSA
jgi:hypothetical protein